MHWAHWVLAVVRASTWWQTEKHFQRKPPPFPRNSFTSMFLDNRAKCTWSSFFVQLSWTEDDSSGDTFALLSDSHLLVKVNFLVRRARQHEKYFWKKNKQLHERQTHLTQFHQEVALTWSGLQAKYRQCGAEVNTAEALLRKRQCVVVKKHETFRFFSFLTDCWTNLAIIVATGVLPRTLTLVLPQRRIE